MLPPRLHDLARDYADKRAYYERAKARIAVIRESMELAEAALFDALENAGMKAVRTDDLGYFRRDTLADAKLIDRATFIEWAKVNMPELLIPNQQRLSKLVRDALNGEPAFAGSSDIPAGVDFGFRRNIAWTPPRGGAAANSAPKETT